MSFSAEDHIGPYNNSPFRIVEFARRTKQAVESNKAIPEAGWRGTWRCLLLVAQFVRYFDFDQNRDKLGGQLPDSEQRKHRYFRSSNLYHCASYVLRLHRP